MEASLRSGGTQAKLLWYPVPPKFDCQQKPRLASAEYWVVNPLLRESIHPLDLFVEGKELAGLSLQEFSITSQVTGPKWDGLR